ncbi:MAG: ABC transporter ATP-binding protein [Elusimicrobia bacterium CG11_big_fil_rev_8_21_14_0_20_64_6]|nr:MAG: ABC transporter ATP-binding protein [Elusimicrobia bacterium CG11_big_fil_rev_8_21_14_0_20_64_6]
MSAVLEARGLIKRYPKAATNAVDGLSLSVREGSCFGLLGPNGAGKTTTVEMLEGILKPDAGGIFYRGSPIGEAFRERTGIQFQDTALQENLTVRELLDLFGALCPTRLSEAELVRLCDLGELLDRDPEKLSGGQRQRVLLALALVNDPDIVFLDEPTTGLDPQARRNFWDLARQIKARGKTILLTTHYMEEAYELCDEVAIVDRGRIIAQGAPDTLLKKHFDGVAIELPKVDFKAPSDGVPGEVLERGETVELMTGEVEKALDALKRGGSRLTHLRVRPRTLEDLFLALTGRELRE